MAAAPPQVLALAPSADAVRRAGQSRPLHLWRELGHTDRAAWGRCTGSQEYTVRADPTGQGWSCSCPSRVQPCRHVLALLWLVAEGAVPPGTEPGWVLVWLARRAAPRRPTARGPVDTSAQQKRAAQRLSRVAGGVEGLEIFLGDLVRDGLGNLANGGFARFEAQARRLVDAQAPGLAQRVRDLAEWIGRGDDWPAHLLSALGRLALLVEAFHSLDGLPPPLQADVRSAIGWSLRREQVLAAGDVVADRWQVIGQREHTGDAVRTLRTWLLGQATGRVALVLNHAPGERPFAQPLPGAGLLAAELAFWPSAWPQRALVITSGSQGPATAGPGGYDRIADLATALADGLALAPFRHLALARLRGVRPGTAAGEPALIDAVGAALPLRGPMPLALLAGSGGAPVDVTGEWDGTGLRLLGLWDGLGWTGLAGSL